MRMLAAGPSPAQNFLRAAAPRRMSLRERRDCGPSNLDVPAKRRASSNRDGRTTTFRLRSRTSPAGSTLPAVVALRWRFLLSSRPACCSITLERRIIEHSSSSCHGHLKTSVSALRLAYQATLPASLQLHPPRTARRSGLALSPTSPCTPFAALNGVAAAVALPDAGQLQLSTSGAR